MSLILDKRVSVDFLSPPPLAFILLGDSKFNKDSKYNVNICTINELDRHAHVPGNYLSI